MKQFTGRCRGGPLDGEDLAHDLPSYTMIIGGPPREMEGLELDGVRLTFGPQTGTYRYVAEQWIWRED